MKVNATLELGGDEVIEIIRQHLLAKGYKLNGAIRLNVGSVCEGYGMAEHDVLKFTGASVPVCMED